MKRDALLATGGTTGGDEPATTAIVAAPTLLEGIILQPWSDELAVRELRQLVSDWHIAANGDSNDAEHDAAFEVADAVTDLFGFDYTEAEQAAWEDQ